MTPVLETLVSQIRKNPQDFTFQLVNRKEFGVRALDSLVNKPLTWAEFQREADVFHIKNWDEVVVRTSEELAFIVDVGDLPLEKRPTKLVALTEEELEAILFLINEGPRSGYGYPTVPLELVDVKVTDALERLAQREADDE